MIELKLPFGLRDGLLFHVSEVDSGLACNCFCPACGQPLIARKGSKVTHHFAHYQAATCEYAVETALHLAAKDILNKEKQLHLPSVELVFNSYKESWLIYEEQIIQFDEVKLEQKLGSIVPDVLVYTDNRPLIVEIKVTHAVDEIKLSKIQKLGISTLEIDLSNFASNPTIEELRDQIVISTRLKRWLYNAKVEAIKKNLFQLADHKKLIQRGFALHVDNCPINKRLWHGKSYANVMDDCIYCEYCIDSGIDENDYLLCTGKRRLDTFQDFLAIKM